MRHVILLAAALILTLILTGCGGEAPPQSEPAPQAPAFETNYAVVAEESVIRFSGTQEGTPFDGRFTEFDADIRFDAENLEDARVRVAIPLAAVDGGSTDRTSTLPQAVWFDVRSFPTAMFESDDISREGDGYVANGTLSLKGSEAPVVLFFTLEDDAQGRKIMRGETTLDRTDWNVGADPWDTEDYVGHAVTLDITVVAQPTG